MKSHSGSADSGHGYAGDHRHRVVGGIQCCKKRKGFKVKCLVSLLDVATLQLHPRHVEASEPVSVQICTQRQRHPSLASCRKHGFSTFVSSDASVGEPKTLAEATVDKWCLIWLLGVQRTLLQMVTSHGASHGASVAVSLCAEPKCHKVGVPFLNKHPSHSAAISPWPWQTYLEQLCSIAASFIQSH